MNNDTINRTISFVKELYNTNEFIPLHAPVFKGNEKKYLEECIDSTFVSSVGKFVDLFEEKIAQFTGAKRAVVTVNGTSALHIALKLASVNEGDEVITQALTFIATANAISYAGATPVFIDVDFDTMGLSPEKLNSFLKKNVELKADGFAYNNTTGNKISACVPMHTFGHPVRIEEIAQICKKYNIELIEDAAESIGSYVGNNHTGLFGKAGILSFNGNKVMTTGGGGMIITNDENFAERAKHITTTAKVPHRWAFVHDEIGYNYRMPNINAALGCAQLENLPEFLNNKRETAQKYIDFFKDYDNIEFVKEREGTRANYWLNAVLLKDKFSRDKFLETTNDSGVMTRPIWTLMNKLNMFKQCQTDELKNSLELEERIVNIPSGVR